MGALEVADLWKPFTAAALIAAGFAYRAVLIHQRGVATAQAAKLAAQVADLEAGDRALRAAIAAQDAAISRIKAQAVQAAALANAREQSASRSGAQAIAAASHRAELLAHAQIDPRCDAAIRWGNEQAVRLGGW